jgi:hypothetical protein
VIKKGLNLAKRFKPGLLLRGTLPEADWFPAVAEFFPVGLANHCQKNSSKNNPLVFPR